MLTMMKKSLITFAAIVSSSFVLANEATLEFETGYAVDGASGLQPSGLAVCDGRLVFVSDKHEFEIYQLTFKKDGTAKAETWKTLSDIPAPPKQKLGWWMSSKRFLAELFGLSGGPDWEGIACDQQGNVFLASEYYFSVLKVDGEGRKEWVVDNLYQEGNQAGLFQRDNAYIEGIMLQGNGLLLAAEREPRGFVKAEDGAKSFYVQPGSQLSEEALPYDYSGLESYQGKIIALERNHYKVCELSGDYGVVACYSFKDIEKSSEWGYKTGKYGLAEGLAIDEDALWIIVDNNGDTRTADPKDARSTVMKFRNPF